MELFMTSTELRKRILDRLLGSCTWNSSSMFGVNTLSFVVYLLVSSFKTLEDSQVLDKW